MTSRRHRGRSVQMKERSEEAEEGSHVEAALFVLLVIKILLVPRHWNEALECMYTSVVNFCLSVTEAEGRMPRGGRE